MGQELAHSQYEQSPKERAANFVAKLSPEQREAVRRLEELQTDYQELEAELRRSIANAKKQFYAKTAVLHDARRAIVCDEQSGLPGFWLQALKNNGDVNSSITDVDEPILRCLRDIRVEQVEVDLEAYNKEAGVESEHGVEAYRIVFDFGKNEFMTNTTVTKTYYLRETDDLDTLELERTIGTDIDWVEDCSPRNERVGRQRARMPSFFDFFYPPSPEDFRKGKEDRVTDAESEDEQLKDLEEVLEYDYDIAETLRTTIVGRALQWFTSEKFTDVYDFESDLTDSGYDDN